MSGQCLILLQRSNKPQKKILLQKCDFKVANVNSNKRLNLITLLLTLKLTDSQRWPAEPHPGAVYCLNALCPTNAQPLSSPSVLRKRCTPERADNYRWWQQLCRKLWVKRMCVLKGPKRSLASESILPFSADVDGDVMSNDNGMLSSSSTLGGRPLPAGRTSVCQPGGGGGAGVSRGKAGRKPLVKPLRWLPWPGRCRVCVAVVAPSARLHFFLNLGTRTPG